MILQYLPDSKEVIGELIEHIFCPKGIFWLRDSCQVNNAAAALSVQNIFPLSNKMWMIAFCCCVLIQLELSLFYEENISPCGIDT